MSPRDHPAIVSRLITKLAGTAKHAVQRIQVDAGKDHSPGGHLEFSEWLRNAAGITPYEEENKLFDIYFHKVKRIRGLESMQDYQQKDSMAMPRFQESLQPSLETDPSSDTDSLGDKLQHSARKKKHLFKLPRRLRDRL